ncbi:alpha/beta hydrolase family protein [Amycolatopsis antarctica]|uniref:alpha/beta hydrolase family protein n=1 Tax=Amycolatopsis antarctica TaxID=1854586 RepID=UPI001056430D|nr:alpha/beta fold hydrolase [Amycolatopsis antarctica]
MPERINFSFAPDGSAAACLCMPGPHRVEVESFSFAGPDRTCIRIPVDTTDGSPSFVVPTATGGVLLAKATPDESIEMVLLGPGGSGERPLGRIGCRSLRVWPSPDPDTLAVITSRHQDDDGALWHVTTSGVRHVADLPGLVLVGGGWLDGVGGRFGVNLRDKHGYVTPAVADLSGQVVPLLAPFPRANRLLQLGHPRTILVASDETGEFRLGLGTTGTGELTFPPGLNRIDGTVLPLAADSRSDHIAVHVSHGVRSKVLLYNATDDCCTELELPLGTLAGPAQFGLNGGSAVLRLALCTPARPAHLMTLTLDSSRPAASPSRASSAGPRVRAETFRGPSGNIEALVYGGASLNDATRVLIALHGGPEDAWRPQFDPLLSRLADAGLTVVAPNQRGSTGYGAKHRDAIHGAWGGPDLADVQHLGRTIATTAPAAEMLLYGISYGAYLALLAVGTDPDQWKRCVAVAPFLSGRHLYLDASPSVRQLLDRLGGCTELDDEIGPRDVLRFAPRIAANLLLIHGDQDETVPVEQSRALRDELIRTGRRTGSGFTYLEIPGAGHNPKHDEHGGSVNQLITDFLACGVSPARPLVPLATKA